MKSIIITFLILGVIGCKSISEVDQLSLTGTWIGLGYQPDIDEAWTISLEFANDGTATVHYPSIPCKAVWELISITEDKVLFREILLTRQDLCNDLGSVEIFQNENHLTALFYLDNQKDQVYAFGLLEKREITATSFVAPHPYIETARIKNKK